MDEEMKLLIDIPIINDKDDILERETFINLMYDKIKTYSQKESLTIGLYGKWGTGKTSIVNLLTNKLSKDNYIIVKFNPWNFKEQDQLISAFFKEFYYQLNIINYGTFWEKIGLFFIKLAKIISFGKFFPNTAPYSLIIAPLIKKYGETLESFKYKESLEKSKNNINKKLSKLNNKIIVCIDDIDRLNDIEINQIFQLVKLLADFPNLIYILPFDKSVIVNALKKSQSLFTNEYLEKIIQVPVYMPDIDADLLNKYLLEKMNKLITHLPEQSKERNAQFMYTGFLNQFQTIRDVNRYLNLLSLKYYPIKYEVDIFDFSLLCLFEIKFIDVYDFIKTNYLELCNNFSYNMGNSDEVERFSKKFKAIIEDLLNKFNNTDSDFIKSSLSFLFPKIEKLFKPYTYAWDDDKEAKLSGRLYVKEKYNLYYQLKLNKNDYSSKELNELLYKLTEDDIVNYLSLLNKQGKLNSLIYIIRNYIDNKLDLTRSTEIINALIKLSNILVFEEKESFFFNMDLSNEYLISSLVLLYIRKFIKENKYTFIKQIFESNQLNLVSVEIMRELENEHGRMYKKKDTAIENTTISLDELLELEKIVLPNLSSYLNNEENLEKHGFEIYFYLLEKLDKKELKEIVKKYIDNENHIVNFILHFYSGGKVLSSYHNPTYHFYIDEFKDIFDINKVYNYLKSIITKDIDLNDRNNCIIVSFIMSYEEIVRKNESYTVDAIKRYIKDNY